MKKLFGRNAIVVALALLLVLSLAGNVILALRMKDAKIWDYFGAGLIELDIAQVQEVTLSDGANPYWRGVVEDPQLLEAVCTMVKDGCYQRAPDFKKNRNPGDGAFPSIKLQTPEHTYVLTAGMDRVRITIDGDSQCYYTNFTTQLRVLLTNKAEEHFRENPKTKPGE